MAEPIVAEAIVAEPIVAEPIVTEPIVYSSELTKPLELDFEATSAPRSCEHCGTKP